MDAPEATPAPAPSDSSGPTATPVPSDSPAPTAPAPAPTPVPLDTSTAALASACVARVQQAVPPAAGVRIVADEAKARSARRPDGLHVVEVPYAADGPSGQVFGSYLCGVAAAEALEFRFFSDHERMNETQWSEYASAARPGNLDTPA